MDRMLLELNEILQTPISFISKTFAGSSSKYLHRFYVQTTQVMDVVCEFDLKRYCRPDAIAESSIHRIRAWN